MQRRFFKGFAALAALAAMSAPASGQPVPAERDFLALSTLDARVATVGHRLAVAALDLCRLRQWRHGFVFLDLAQVAPAYREAANRAFGAADGLGVTAIVADGPAARSGLRVGDVILSLDGRAPPALEPRSRPEQRFAAIAALVESAFVDGRASVELLRGGARVTLAVEAAQGCASSFQIVREGGRVARADGRNVQITLRLVEYAADDAELAAVIAHEFAHNILRHRERLRARDRRPSVRETEVEADRLSVYLMERAGYDPEAAVRFWTRFGPHPLNFLRSGDHPGWRQRVATLQAEIAAIRDARAAGRIPVPSFMTLVPV